ncbi:micronuclear linker histone polyprotein-like [Ambystoma mexicanum]|uniref:micronuclear linker histone polyprotein-like n=1 Tax=Ambystoma mexicanum TaxID=8296 RepID=UPI0037E70D5E
MSVMEPKPKSSCVHTQTDALQGPSQFVFSGTTTKNGAVNYDQSEIIYISEETSCRLPKQRIEHTEKEPSPSHNGNPIESNDKDQAYPIFCLQHGTSTGKTDTSEPGPTLQKAKKIHPLKGSPSIPQDPPLVFKITNDSETKCSPRTVEDFLDDDQLMNISEHLEKDLTSSLQTEKDQVEKRENRSSPLYQQKSPPFYTMEERRNNLNHTSRPNQNKTSQRKVSFTSKSEPPSLHQETPKLENRHKHRERDRKSSRDDSQRESNKKSSKDHRSQENEPSVRPHYKSKTEKYHDRRHPTKISIWTLKIEQRSENRDEIILNRKGVLNLFGFIPALRQIKSEDLKLVDPYHSNHRAKTILHIPSKKIQMLITNEAEDFSKLGFKVLENLTKPKEQRESKENDLRTSKSKATASNRIKDHPVTEKPSQEQADLGRRTERNPRSGTNRDINSQNKQRNSANNEPSKKGTPKAPQTSNLPPTKQPVTQQLNDNPQGIWSWLPKVLAKNLNK